MLKGESWKNIIRQSWDLTTEKRKELFEQVCKKHYHWASNNKLSQKNIDQILFDLGLDYHSQGRVIDQIAKFLKQQEIHDYVTGPNHIGNGDNNLEMSLILEKIKETCRENLLYGKELEAQKVNITSIRDINDKLAQKEEFKKLALLENAAHHANVDRIFYYLEKVIKDQKIPKQKEAFEQLDKKLKAYLKKSKQEAQKQKSLTRISDEFEKSGGICYGIGALWSYCRLAQTNARDLKNDHNLDWFLRNQRRLILWDGKTSIFKAFSKRGT